MSREILEIVQKMNPKALETQFILQCAPMIAGLKPSNLLIISRENEKNIRRILKGTSLSCETLVRVNHKVTMFIFRQPMLEQYLSQAEVKLFLKELGHQEKNLQELLLEVQIRYQAYAKGNGAFPHELGLLLGYPVEDVKGYMIHKGRDSLCTGYWQVYENPAEKKSLFRKYEMAKEGLIRLFSDGIAIRELIASPKHYMI